MIIFMLKGRYLAKAKWTSYPQMQWCVVDTSGGGGGGGGGGLYVKKTL